MLINWFHNSYLKLWLFIQKLTVIKIQQNMRKKLTIPRQQKWGCKCLVQRSLWFTIDRFFHKNALRLKCNEIWERNQRYHGSRMHSSVSFNFPYLTEHDAITTSFVHRKTLRHRLDVLMMFFGWHVRVTTIYCEIVCRADNILLHSPRLLVQGLLWGWDCVMKHCLQLVGNTFS